MKAVFPTVPQSQSIHAREFVSQRAFILSNSVWCEWITNPESNNSQKNIILNKLNY